MDFWHFVLHTRPGMTVILAPCLPLTLAQPPHNRPSHDPILVVLREERQFFGHNSSVKWMIRCRYVALAKEFVMSVPQ